MSRLLTASPCGGVRHAARSPSSGWVSLGILAGLSTAGGPASRRRVSWRCDVSSPPPRRVEPLQA